MKDKNLTFSDLLQSVYLEYARNQRCEESKRVDVNEVLSSNPAWSLGADGKISLLCAKIQECEAPKPFAGLALGEPDVLCASDNKQIHDMAADAFSRVSPAIEGEKAKWVEAYCIARMRVALASNDVGATLANGWSINLDGNRIFVKSPEGKMCFERSL